MSEILMGIDVGGTNTDGVLIEKNTGLVIKKLKVPTEEDLVSCTGKAMTRLLEGVDPALVRRIALSTTIVTNAVVLNRLEPVGMILMAGPGIDPSSLSDDPNVRVIEGAMDHRGREIKPLNPREAERVLESFAIKGISVVAVAGKFSARNPGHENTVASLAERNFEYVCRSHALGGALNFPRRAATAYLAAGVWRILGNFIAATKKTAGNAAPGARLYLLRADGGSQLADSFVNPAEAALSGPAASIMGIAALSSSVVEAVGLDVGGSTTDISFFVKGSPLAEPKGALIGPYLTQIRAIFNRSIPLGCDCEVKAEDGRLLLTGWRKGPAAALGGPVPTPTDALVLLGHAEGDVNLAALGLMGTANALGIELTVLAKLILAEFASKIKNAVVKILEEVNSRPVYTLHELLEDHRVVPAKVVLVGGPAKGLKQFIEDDFAIPVEVPANFEVANAVGAAVSGLNTEVNALADTASGTLTIPEAGIHRAIAPSFSYESLYAEAEKALNALAAKMDEGDPEKRIYDIADRESFNVIEGYRTVGSIHRLRLQLRPSILCRVER